VSRERRRPASSRPVRPVAHHTPPSHASSPSLFPPRSPSATELLSDRFIRSSKHDDLLELLAPLGEVGPETAAALGDKPGYAAAEIKMPTKSEFAAGTTWVLWDGSGSMATESRRKVEESACTTEDMAAMLSGLGDMGMESVSDDDRGRSAATAREPDAAGASAAAAAPP